jgi:hypothetical protein
MIKRHVLNGAPGPDACIHARPRRVLNLSRSRLHR